MLDYLWLLVGGQLLVYLLMKLPPAKRLSKLEEQTGIVGYFGGLFLCNLCLGVWIYFALSCFYHITLGPYVPIVSEAVSAGIFSFVAHIFLLGLKVKYGNWDVI